MNFEIVHIGPNERESGAARVRPSAPISAPISAKTKIESVSAMPLHFTNTSGKTRELVSPTSLTKRIALAKAPSDAVFDLPVAAGAGFYNACDLR